MTVGMIDVLRRGGTKEGSCGETVTSEEGCLSTVDKERLEYGI